MRSSVLTMFAASVLSLGACIATDDTPDDIAATIDTSAAEVARVTLPDGATWRFLEAEPGELALWGTLVEGRKPTLPTDDSIERMSYVDIYRQLTTAPVPPALLAAQARADANTETETGPDESGLVDYASPTGKDPVAQISAADFQDNYCWNSGWDFSYCWPSTGGNPKVVHKTHALWGYVGAVDHTVNFRFRYKHHSYSDWTTVVSAQALPGQVHTFHQHNTTYRRWRVWEVFGNSGAVRYSAFGDY